MRNGLIVVKEDKTNEPYYHTKILGTLNNAFSAMGISDVSVSEQLAEVVTFYLYCQLKCRTIHADEIHSIIKAVLQTTGYEDVAEVLAEHHFRRKLKRRRVMVVTTDLEGMLRDGNLNISEISQKNNWDKSVIIDDLQNEYNLQYKTARHVASLVEERIFKMDVNEVNSSLVRQIMLSETARVLRTQKQMQTA